MKLEDPIETWEFFSKTAGESYVTKVDAFQTKSDSLTNSYLDTKSASAEKRARIDLLDLKEQREGEMHIFFKSKIVRGKAFYANPPPIKEMRLNHQLGIDAPEKKTLAEFEHRLDRFAEVITRIDRMQEHIVDQDELAPVFENYMRESKKSLIERGLDSLKSYHSENVIEEEAEEIDDTPLDEINMFTPLRLSDPTVPMIVGDEFEAFSQPLVRRNETKNKLEFLEKLAGKPPKVAAHAAKEVIRDMQIATFYPPHLYNQASAEEIANLAIELSKHVAKKVGEQGSGDGSDDFF